MSDTKRTSLSMEEFHDLLTFDGSVQGYPTTNAPVIRDDNELLIYANRSKNADNEWEIRSYRVLGDGVSFTATDVDRANVAAILVEKFDPDALTTDDRHRSSQPIKYGIPVAVAVDGKPAISAWLYARQGATREQIAERMAVGERTVNEYLSRFRRRGTGIPDDLDVPDVGEVVPEVPSEFDPTAGRQQIVTDGGTDASVIERLRSVVRIGANEPCKHEQKDIHPSEDEYIWHLEDSYLKDEKYWSQHDAAFVECRTRVKEFRCFGCGEQKTIETGEKTGNVRWKADMTTEELAEMRQQVNGGSYYNGRLWWEDIVWGGDPAEVATRFDWSMDIGYQEWKDCEVQPDTSRSEGSQ